MGLLRTIAYLFIWFSGFVSLTEADEDRAAAEERCTILELFVRDDSLRSQAAREFIQRTYGRRRGLMIVLRDVAKNDKDLDRFWGLADQFRVNKPGLPGIYVSGRFMHGWDDVTTPDRLQEALTVEIFVRQGCKHCAAAHPVLFEQLAPRYPAYEFVELNISKSAEALQRVQTLSKRYGVQAASVPVVHLCGRLTVGFLDATTSFRQWDDVLRPVTVPCPPEKTQFKRPSNRRAENETNWRGGGIFHSMAMGAEVFEPQEEIESAVAGRHVTPVAKSGELDSEDSEAPPPRRGLPQESPEESGAAPVPVASPEFVVLPGLGEVRWRDWGMPAFTLLVGLIDGFNPCAMWVLLFLLSLLVNLHDRWKVLSVAGTFVVISGAAYLAFMAAWLNVFQLIGLVRPAQICLGVMGITIGLIHVKDFFAFKQGLSLSIPESAKPGLYERMRRIVLAETLWAAVTGAAVLAVLVNVIELLCTAGLPAMYTGILTLQHYPTWLNALYLLLYLAGYLFDDSLMVAIVVTTLSRRKLQERGGRILKLISGIAILLIGALMLFKPDWLI